MIINIILKILGTYMLCSILSYFIFNRLSLGFTDKKGNDVKLEDKQVRTVKIIISALWIYFLPALAIDYMRRYQKGDD